MKKTLPRISFFAFAKASAFAPSLLVFVNADEIILYYNKIEKHDFRKRIHVKITVFLYIKSFYKGKQVTIRRYGVVYASIKRIVLLYRFIKQKRKKMVFLFRLL